MNIDTNQPPQAGFEPAFLVPLAPAQRAPAQGVDACAITGPESDPSQPAARRLREFRGLDDPNRKLLEALIQRMGVGDQDALGEFYDRLSPTLFGLALRILRDEMGAQEVLQDAFLYIWNKASTYAPELSSPFSWAIMILRCKAIDHLRARQRMTRIVERATEEFPADRDVDSLSSEEPFFREQRGLMRAALTRLPAEQRESLNLAFFGGLTHEEIAHHLNLPIGTVKSRIRRGLHGLRDLVADAI